MSEELIDRYVDRAAVKSDTEYLSGLLTQINDQFLKLDAFKLKLSGASGFKDVANGVKEVNGQMAAVKGSTKQFEQTLLQAESAMAKYNGSSTEMLRNAKLIAQTQNVQAKTALTEQKQLAASLAEQKKNSAAAAAEEKKRLAETTELQREKILLFRQEQEEQKKLKEQTEATNRAEEDRLSNAAFKSTGGTSAGASAQSAKAASSAGPSFIPSTELERNIDLLQKEKLALAANQAQQKQLKKDLADGVISRSAYNREINKSIQAELEHKKTIALTRSFFHLARTQEPPKTLTLRIPSADRR